MALNFENIGTELAMIKTKRKIKGIPTVSVDSKKDAENNFYEYHLKGTDSFLPIPDPNSERSIIYITGKSGSGKSYYCKEWIKEYKKLYPKNPIYLFSSLDSDPTIDEIKDLKRIKLAPDFLKEEFTSEDFKDALVIADDTDCLNDKKMLKHVNKILDSILQTGRHWRTIY
jgi:Cdc6-like AAA superfamily ATPase